MQSERTNASLSRALLAPGKLEWRRPARRLGLDDGIGKPCRGSKNIRSTADVRMSPSSQQEWLGRFAGAESYGATLHTEPGGLRREGRGKCCRSRPDAKRHRISSVPERDSEGLPVEPSQLRRRTENEGVPVSFRLRHQDAPDSSGSDQAALDVDAVEPTVKRLEGRAGRTFGEGQIPGLLSAV